MKTSSAPVGLFLLLGIFVGLPKVADAESPVIPFPEKAKTFLDPAELILRSAPAGAVEKLKDSATFAEGASELNRYFGAYAINRSVVLHTTVEAAEPRPDVRNAFRIRAASVPLQYYGGTMKRLSWLYFKESDAAAANSVKVGSEVIVVGWVRRCEVVMTEDGPRLNFDLQHTRIESASNPLGEDGKVADASNSRPLTGAAIAGTWTWDAVEKIYPGTVDFESNGTGSHGARNNMTWKITGEREITITHSTRGTAVVRFDAQLRSFEGTDYGGKPVTGKRFRF